MQLRMAIGLMTRLPREAQSLSGSEPRETHSEAERLDAQYASTTRRHVDMSSVHFARVQQGSGILFLAYVKLGLACWQRSCIVAFFLSTPLLQGIKGSSKPSKPMLTAWFYRVKSTIRLKRSGPTTASGMMHGLKPSIVATMPWYGTSMTTIPLTSRRVSCVRPRATGISSAVCRSALTRMQGPSTRKGPLVQIMRRSLANVAKTATTMQTSI